MLRQSEALTIVLVSHAFSTRGHVRVYTNKARKRWFDWPKWRLSREEFAQFLQGSYVVPHRFTMDGTVYWLFEGQFYKDTDALTADEVAALLVTRKRQRQHQIDRAKTISAAPATHNSPTSRGTIPDDVKMLVWDRDRGRCRKCGSNHELQFDHVIPISMGGASTPENLQVLCGRCNRAKGASLV